jgi:hypothetical protein
MTPNEMLAMIAQLRRERNEARDQYDNLATEHVLAVNKLAEERDEAREAFVIATDQMVQAQCKTREALRERDEAKADAARIADIEALAQIKELMYIGERAIALAEIGGR